MTFLKISRIQYVKTSTSLLCDDCNSNGSVDCETCDSEGSKYCDKCGGYSDKYSY
jgi:predicted RNA-binding Zn-ribbon protein involved in translation (DUF1610 family)